MLAASPAVAAEAKASDPAQLVDAFIAAQRSFDQAALARLTAPEYVEISPLGDFDPREKMLGFYAADKKQPVPEITVSEREVVMLGDTAIVTARLAIGPRAVRAGYVAHKDKAGWRLVSAQFTPVRTPPAQ
ncbi:nuclear transport factor 2 family protein [Sphingomonas aracearum]|uniref:Nuclear transport factor 2 family protein n=1 Tax=Sphingomonas aracearum TaxID=2283317 RepID=A0A369W0F5_9SPHN|nr:nuclear transport factor 2 family protein [Sphingomonas aracearum]